MNTDLYTTLIDLVTKGKDNQEIADHLDLRISSIPKLLKKYGISRSNIYNKNRKSTQYWNRVAVDVSSNTATEYFSIYDSCIDDELFK